MESSAIDTQRSAEKIGTRENPEVAADNVPGHIIPIIQRELEDFQTETESFLGGTKPEADYIPFRLRQGVYGQRQPGVQMLRVKLPLGGVSADQMEAFARVVERFAPLRKGHITTRQNVQIHHVPTGEVPEALRVLAEANLTSREGCGNTVRNVTGDPYAGVLAGEAFDPTPHASAFVRYFVRHHLTQLLPRKFKVAFTADDSDRAITLIHDLGFIPRMREIGGRSARGFEIRTGGGTAIMPRVGHTLFDFVPVEEFLKVSEAVLRIFDRADELRANKARARLKFLVDRVGIEEFRRMVDLELAGDWAEGREWDPDALLFVDDEEARAPAATPPRRESPNGATGEFSAFVDANVTAQRQPGFSAVEVKVPRGDLTPEQFRGLATIMREFAGGGARTTVGQNIVLRWVRSEALHGVWEHLRALDLADPGAQEVTDVVSCPGTDSCKLGITSSMGLNRAVQERVTELGLTDPLTRRIHVKMSGCPNGCGQHHIANIGFYGASIKVGDRQLPAYIAHVGGSCDDGVVAMGKRLKVRIPAKRVPAAVERFIRFYEESRLPEEPFNAFAERVGTGEFERIAKDLGVPEEFTVATMQEFIDWNRKEPFQVIRGEGECAI